MPLRSDRHPSGGVLAAVVAISIGVAGCSTPLAPDTVTTAPVPAPAPTAGVPHGLSLTPATARTITTRGTVLDAVDVRGTIVVNALDVTIRRSRIVCAPGDLYAILVQPGASATIIDTELSGDCSSGALQGQDFVARGVDIHGVTSDGIKIDGGNVLIEDSFIRDFAPSESAHADGVQASVPIGNVIIRDSLIDPGMLANGAIFLVAELDNGSLAGPVLLEGNTFGGGGDAVHIAAADGGATGQVRVVNNVWRRNSAFGPVYQSDFEPAEWSLNRFEDGTPIGPP